MDETPSEATKLKHNVTDTGLHAVTASLEMLTVNTNLSPSGSKAVLQRITQIDLTENLNRRCSLRPRKRTCSDVVSDGRKKKVQDGQGEVDIKEYYLNRNLKRRLNNLETIYEEKDESETTMYMSVKRYKRMIQFNEKPTDSKLKKRRAKIKKVFGSKINFRRKYAFMEILFDKPNGIKTESSIKIESEVK